MSLPEHNLRVDYIEFPVVDVPGAKTFYNAVFGWNFEDYGPDYTCFHDGRLGGGFVKASDQISAGGPLIVIYTTDLEGLKQKVIDAGGKILKEPFDFPGGRRFHFSDPSGHQLAIWTNV